MLSSFSVGSDNACDPDDSPFGSSSVEQVKEPLCSPVQSKRREFFIGFDDHLIKILNSTLYNSQAHIFFTIQYRDPIPLIFSVVFMRSHYETKGVATYCMYIAAKGPKCCLPSAGSISTNNQLSGSVETANN